MVITDEDDALESIDAFLAGLATFEVGHVLKVAAVAGVPPDLTDPDPNATTWWAQDLDAILADPRMQGPVACEAEGLASAAPASRIVESIRRHDSYGLSGYVESICRADWTNVARFLGISDHVHVLWGGCLPPSIRRNEPGPLPCVLEETLRRGGDCGLGRVAVGSGERGDTLCHVCQLEGEGIEDPFGHDTTGCTGDADWSYDPSEGCGIAYTPDAGSDCAEASLRLACDWAAVGQ